ncbi:hypothetical protein B0H10DRAFT_2093411 [Mycena sp. CBHHK59/15]|nr:hypothetical protein B0H10DRAFT_2093411 [Mycena sp. CBHHK59/15]
MSVADLRTRLAEIDASISQQNASIAEKRALVEELEEIRATIQHQLDRVVYPVLNLPLEIISEIFLHCLPTPEKITPDPLHVPVLLLHVCRTWRSIALSIPGLWAALHLSVYDIPDGLYKTGAFEEFVETWFSRACTRPLSLSLHGDFETDFGSGRFSATLLRYALRLQCIALHFDRDYFIHLADLDQSERFGSFPLLEKLEFSLPFHDGIEDQPNPSEMFSGASRLREVTLRENAVPSMFSLPWGQLTTFTCESLPGEEILDLLYSAHSLIECTVSVDPYIVVFHTKTIQNLRLQSLTLLDGSRMDFLRFLKLPVLRNLHLIDIEDIDNNHLLSFLSRSGASLQRFSCMSGGELISVQWFCTMAGLVDVELRAPGWTFLTNFFRMLDRTQNKDFLPNLGKLTLLDCENSGDEDLMKALSSRCSLGPDGLTKLESFKLIWPPRCYVVVSKSTVIQLRDLVSRDMKIHFGSERRSVV